MAWRVGSASALWSLDHRRIGGPGVRMWPFTASTAVIVFAWVVMVAATVEAAFGAAKPHERFDKEIEKAFLQSSRKSYALRVATNRNKPLLVLLTKKGCGACQNLKQSVNIGHEFQQLVKSDKFILVHAENDAALEWQEAGHHYAPQTYFYAPGELDALPILGSSEKSPHFFHDEATLMWGARKMLEVVASGERSNPDKSLSKGEAKSEL